MESAVSTRERCQEIMDLIDRQLAQYDAWLGHEAAVAVEPPGALAGRDELALSA